MNQPTPKLLAVLTLSATAALAAQSARAQNLLVNGSFQTGDLTGWSITPDALYGVNYSPLVNHNAAYVFNTVGGTLSQTFSTIPGNTYQLYVLMWAESFGGGFARINLNGGAPLLNDYIQNAPSRSFLQQNFVATGSSTTLNLGFRSTPGLGVMYFTEVSVIDVTPVPAPGAAGMLALGGLVAVRRRR